MIRFTTRNMVGLVGSVIMTVCSIGVLNASLTSVDAHRTILYSAPVALHSATIAEWQLAEEKDLVVVRASRV